MTKTTVNQQDDRPLSPRELAARWGISPLVLRNRRKKGLPPTYNPILRGYMLSAIVEFEGGGLVPQKELAERWGIGVRALQKREKAGSTPPKVKIGSEVFYRMNDIVALEQSGAE
ncbi:MAG TPA: hypothetical protein VKY70_00920 [Pseudomonas sp.]|nr:hypothetical protein [Pseudomonas sp.]